MNLISLADWSRQQIEQAIELALTIKRQPREYAHALDNRVLLMIFQKPSLRTRLSFEVAMLQMGGHALHYDLGMSPWAAGKETAADTARTSSRYVDAIMARLFNRADMLDLAAHATVPVINGLTDFEHPCQALGDLLTIRQRKGRLAGVKLAYVGDGNNNVTHSLLDGCAKVGVHISVGCPAAAAYSPAAEVRSRAAAFARDSDARIEIVHDARAAVADADVVYTDTWMSYHIPAEKRDERYRALHPFQVTTELMRHAKPDAVFMHCLPAQRGVEQIAEVIDGPQSIVFDQAENRLHIQKAALAMLLIPSTGDKP
jgi:ornithine carbamoyltransferase